jgi:transposase
MARPIQPLILTTEQRRQLRRIVNRPRASVRDVRRAWIILNRAEGLSQEQIAERNRVNRSVVAVWEKRFRQHGLAGLADAPGRGRKERLSPDLKARILTQATQPLPGRRRWSVRTMARAVGVSKATVQRLWSANEIKPHLTRVFKLSQDPQFEEKFWDIIGLYLNPPDKALVLCCDEKSQCQALERSQPGLPLGVGHIRTQTHDYYRHGTVTLFAALSYLDGKIFGQTAPRHRHQEWLRFLKQLHQQTPPDLTLHLILDNYGTHKHPKVQAWLKLRNRQQLKAHSRDRFVLHFTPTSSSWMNLVERFFRDLTEDTIRDGSFHSVPELVTAIEDYLAERDLNPKRYVWKASGEAILAKIHRARVAQAKAIESINNA